MDPATATIITALGSNLLSNIFGGSSQQQGPSQAQILALQRQQQEQAARTQAWIIGGGLVGLGILAFVLVSRK